VEYRVELSTHQPVMVHRALFGSVERFFGVLIEHYAGAFPMWLAPVQVGLVPISNEKHLEYAESVKARLEAAGLRVELDASNGKMQSKIRDFGLQKIPFILILGDKEAATDSVSVRVRAKGDEGSVTLEEFLARAKTLVAEHSMGL
jgi:threonyl-tRNA synthetase